MKPLDKPLLLDIYRKMVTVRQFEETAADLFLKGQIPGFLHVYVGEEAVAAGVMSHLTPQDMITSTHRGHGHVGQRPVGGALERGGERPADGAGRHRLRGAPNDSMDHEFRGEASAGGHDGRADRERTLDLEMVPEGGPAHLLQPPQARGGRLQEVRGGADDRVGGHEREIVHHHLDHEPVSSRERRYMSAASRGRFRRS